VSDLVASIFARLVADPHLTPAARMQLGRLQPVVAGPRSPTGASSPTPATRCAGSSTRWRSWARWAPRTTTSKGACGGMARRRGARPDRGRALRSRHRRRGPRPAWPRSPSATTTCRPRTTRSCARCAARRRNAPRLQDSALEIAPPHLRGRGRGRFRRLRLRDLAARPRPRAPQHGPGQPAWRAELETLDDLLWTLTPRATAEEHERLRTLTPSVRDRVRQGLIRAQLAPEQIEARLAEMDRLHEEVAPSPRGCRGNPHHDRGPGPRLRRRRDDDAARLRRGSSSTRASRAAPGSSSPRTTARTCARA